MTIGWRIVSGVLLLFNVYVWLKVALLAMRVLGLG